MSNHSVLKFQRGEVYLVEEHGTQGSEQKKTRPWVLVGATPINRARSTVIGLPLSTQAPEKPPISIKVHLNNATICAVIDQIRALDKKRFLRYEGELSPHEMGLIDDSLRQIIAL
jgi:mRNA interferase MazF